MIYAVDFDGTLCESAYPGIGKPRQDIIDSLIEWQKNGDKLILWTCREDELLDAAVKWCREHGLVFDAINDNLPEETEKWGHNPRKLGADVYIDDKSINL